MSKVVLFLIGVLVLFGIAWAHDTLRGLKQVSPSLTPDTSLKNKNGIPVSWEIAKPQVPGKKIAAGDVVSVGIRDKNGSGDDAFMYALIVSAPNGSATVASRKLTSNGWSTLSFPNDFGSLASSMQKGTYTLIYEVNKKAVGCSGFVIQ